MKSTELKEEELSKVNGGDELEDAVKETLKRQEEERIKKLLEEAEEHRKQRESGELNESIETMLDLLRKLNGIDDEDVDKTIHVG